MTEETQSHHRQFSVSAHNEAMDILYADAPTAAETESLIGTTHVAHWHWSQREDQQPQNISVALWALSRAYSANVFGERALHYADQALALIENEGLLPSFYGYCHEALARAYDLLGQTEQAKQHLATAYEISETVPNEQAKAYLLSQINSIEIKENS